VVDEVVEAYGYQDVPRRDMVDYVPKTAKTLLDVGCGRGGFGQSLRERGPIELTGIELDPVAAVAASERYDRVITGAFPSDVPAGSTFDCIVFNDILEHLVDPWGALGESAKMLSPGGVVVASIPNMRYWPVFWPLLRRGEWRYVSDGVLDRTHLRFFTLGSVVEMFTGAGFEIDMAKPINQVAFDNLEPQAARVLKVVCKLRERLGTELRAQQFAVVARPRAGSGH
jgi:2-polyprenyl-3-methyl-5-hydroxy-6-metoxy-1,4-benzoquinol methylase